MEEAGKENKENVAGCHGGESPLCKAGFVSACLGQLHKPGVPGL